ncbi:hypothetical protein FQN54_001981 [Arachnomyces sp. PD_36]|nr:hypothetical protein FQN54_001981 [Arachnomyces sp. PD_36]
MTSLYDRTVPIFIRGLENLSACLEKATATAAEAGTSEKELLETRLSPDMYGLAFQVQRVSDSAKNSINRMSNFKFAALAIEDNETTFPELQERIKKTLDYLKTVKPEDVNGNEEEHIKFKVGPNEAEFVVKNYVADFAVPNFYFHISIAYAILRSKGIPVGKMDFLGKIL